MSAEQRGHPLEGAGAVRPVGQSQQPRQSHQPSPRPRNRPTPPSEDAFKEEDPRSRDPPPPYTAPVIRTRLGQTLAAVILANHGYQAAPNRPGMPQTFRSSSVAAAVRPQEQPPTSSPSNPSRDSAVSFSNDLDDGDYGYDDDNDSSPINLRISTRVNVARDNNVVVLPCSPADQANAIAASVVKALKSGTVSEGGIPMIDQDGKPRPVKIEVDAGITVEGSSNIVGTETGVMDVLKARHAATRVRMSGAGINAAGPNNASVPSSSFSSATSAPCSGVGGGRTSGRRRSASEMEEGEGRPAATAKKAKSSE